MLKNRAALEKIEALYLAPYAVKSSHSKGRKFKESPDDERLCFQRDKDRIVHCKAFRRLDEKTQVFIAGSGDHYRTRLTHTLEVAQISRDIARRLGLNEDLCEVISLAHDLGHPPFGHGGEEALDEIMHKFGMHFEHNEQSRRIVEKLEKAYPDFDGLNLSFEVLDGLIKHQTSWDQVNKNFKISAHLEAQVVNIADEIAYTNHDIDDGLRSGIINLEEMETFELWQKAKKEVQKKYGKNLQKPVFISRMISTVISMMIEDLCMQTGKNIKKHKKLLANFSPKMNKMVKALREFLYKNFYMSPQISKFIKKGKMMIKKLFEFYIKNPDKFPKKGFKIDSRFPPCGGQGCGNDKKYGNDKKVNKDYIIAVKDYIAGMTDGFLEKEYEATAKVSDVRRQENFDRNVLFGT